MSCEFNQFRSAGAGCLDPLRDGGQQVAGVVFLGTGEDIGHRPLFNEPAAVHDRNRVGDFAHHGQVVGDEQHRHAVFLLNIANQMENLVLDGDIEGCGRFVGDQEFWPAGQGHGDDHPLTLSAGQLMRIAVDPILRIVDAGAFQQLQGPLVSLGLV